MSLKNNNPYDEKFKKPVDNNPMRRIGNIKEYSHLSTNDGMGESSYDEGLNWYTDVNQNDIQGTLNEYRAQNQPWAHKFGAFVGRAAVKAGSEIAKLPGVIGGLALAPFAEEGKGFDTAFNNAWINSIDDWNDEVKQEYLPVYVKKAVKEGNLWDNITSIDFWATDGADGIGFIAAMMTPGAIIEGVNLGSKLISSTARLSKLAKFTKQTEDAISVMSKLGITPKNINSVTSVVGNTIIEAGAESKSVSDSIIADADRRLELGKLSKAGGISQEEYDYIVNVQRPIAMRDTFISNAAILVGPNAIMHQAIWGKTAEKLTKTVDNVKDRILSSAKRYGKATLSEGFWEEGLQTTAEEYFKEKALNKELGKDNDFNIGDFANAYIDTVSSTDGQKAIFLGGILGGAMTSITGRMEDNRNRKVTNEILKGIDDSVSKFNDSFENDIYIKKEDGTFDFEEDENGKPTTKRKVDPVKVIEIAKSLGYTEQQSEVLDLALRSGNTEVINNIKKQAIFNMILPGIYNGEAGLKALKDKLETDSTFQEIISRNKTEEDKKSIKKFINDTLETASFLQKENEKFKNFSKEVIDLNHPNASESDKNDYLNKLNASYLKAKYDLYDKEKQLSKITEKRKQAFEEHVLDIDPDYDSSSDSPISNMKNKSIISNEDLLERAKRTKEAIESNSLLKSLDDKYNKIRKEINTTKSYISDIWNNENLVKKNYNSFINKRNDIRKNYELNKEKADIAINNIKDTSNITELEEIEKNLSPEIKEIVKNNIEQRKNELFELQKETIKQNNKKFNTQNSNKEAVGLKKDKEFNYDLQQENFEQPVTTNNNESLDNSKKITRSKYNSLHFNNNRTISKNEKTGEKLPFVNDEWIEFENNPVNKVGTVLSFSLNENPGNNPNLKLAYELTNDLLNNKITVDDIIKSKKNNINSVSDLREFLANYLPLNVGFANSNISSPIDTLNGNKAKDEIFNKTTKIQRLQIVNHILKGGKLSDISTTISGQMPGLLQLDNSKKGVVAENLISGLQYLQLNELVNEKGELTKKGYQYFRENFFNVIDFGQLQNAKGDVLTYNTKDGIPLSKGEFYLKIPMTNGEPFYLKLNTKFISKDKANVIYEIFKYRFKEKVVNKDITLKEIALENQELTNLIKKELADEIYVIRKHKKADEITLKDVIDILIYDNNSSKVAFKFSGTGRENESVLKYGENIIENVEELENKKDELIDWITSNKRQNIKFGKKNNIGQVNTNSIDYLNYLITNGIINTNAVTGRDSNNKLKPTFGGYTNIYWKNLNIKSNKESNISEFEKNPQNAPDLSKFGIKKPEQKPIETNNLFEEFKNDLINNNISELKVDNINYLYGINSNVLVNAETTEVIKDIEKIKDIINKHNSKIKLPIFQINLDKIINKINNSEFKGYPAPESNDVKIDDVLALENENNSENISEKEWNDFVDNNNVSERILNIIANKIINNESFSVKEQAIHSSNVSKIENILNNIRNSQKNSVSLQEDLPEQSNAFGNNPNVVFTHQIEGTKENKDINEMKNKIKNEKLNLTSDQIDTFIQINGFTKYLSIYIEEKGLKEDELTDQDYINIIEKNYSNEQINKICNN